MFKTISSSPIFIQNLEEFKCIENNLHGKQYIQFKCENCKKVMNRRVWRMKKNNYSLLCNNCLFNFKVKSRTEEKRKEISEKRKNTNFKKYGVEYSSKSQEILNRMKQTCLKRYGVEYTSQIKESREKAKQTWENKSDDEKRKIFQKREKTCLGKFGKDSYSKTKDFKIKVENTWKNKSIEEKQRYLNKSKQTWLQKYGVTNPTYIPDHDKKTKQTCLKKYGVENVMQLNIFKNKLKQTMIIKYGVGHSPSHNFTYQCQSFDSSWELAVWIWGKDNEFQFGSIIREPVALKYMFNNKEYTYYPDFQIGNKLVEVKGPQFFTKDGKMQNPFNHVQDELFEAKHQCGLANGVEFWGEKEMKPILKYVEIIYGKDYLNQFKKK